jgi:hypothetical protein
VNKPGALVKPNITNRIILLISALMFSTTVFGSEPRTDYLYPAATDIPAAWVCLIVFLLSYVLVMNEERSHRLRIASGSRNGRHHRLHRQPEQHGQVERDSGCQLGYHSPLVGDAGIQRFLRFAGLHFRRSGLAVLIKMIP